MINVDAMIYKDMALMNVTSYDDMKEYEKYNNMDCEEFKDNIENGFIQDITLGTYNGYNKEFTKRGITENHIIDAIFQDLHELDYYNIAYDNGIFDNENIINWDNIRWVYEYSTMNEIFTIGNDIYIKRL